MLLMRGLRRDVRQTDIETPVLTGLTEHKYLENLAKWRST